MDRKPARGNRFIAAVHGMASTPAPLPQRQWAPHGAGYRDSRAGSRLQRSRTRCSKDQAAAPNPARPAGMSAWDRLGEQSGCRHGRGCLGCHRTHCDAGVQRRDRLGLQGVDQMHESDCDLGAGPEAPAACDGGPQPEPAGAAQPMDDRPPPAAIRCRTSGDAAVRLEQQPALATRRADQAGEAPTGDRFRSWADVAPSAARSAWGESSRSNPNQGSRTALACTESSRVRPPRARSTPNSLIRR